MIHIMKKTALLLAVLVLGAIACHKNSYGPGNPTGPVLEEGNFEQTNLASDTMSYGTKQIFSFLRNPWGIAINRKVGIIWIASNQGNDTEVFDSTGQSILFSPIASPSNPESGGTPTGVAFNPTPDFPIPGFQSPAGSNTPTTARFIFVGEDGIVSAWGFTPWVVKVADRSSAGAVYKGCALDSVAGSHYLYAANFTGRTIDVFDKSFNPVTGFSFKDPSIPSDFGPFNIAGIGGMLYVTYAKMENGDKRDLAGDGNGYIDIFTTDGRLLRKFASRGPLNSPWGIAQSPDGFGLPLHSIVVGNTGDGKINVYDSTGLFKGALQNNGQALVIPGLRGLDFFINEYPQASPSKLFFTAGPQEGRHGLFGYLNKQ
jgi:uncharacterized protein (TIGR03118 family)